MCYIALQAGVRAAAAAGAGLTLSPDAQRTANAMLPTILDEPDAGLSLAPTPLRPRHR
jgi:hypothetical protein